MTRRLENEDEDKFWEAWVKDDLIFCYRYGKLGSPGHLKLKKFKTPAEADAELEEKLAEKLGEGFVEVGADAPAKAAEAEDEDEDEAEDEEEDEDEDEDEEEDEEEEEAPKRKPAKVAKPAAAKPAPEAPAGPKVPPRVPARMPTPERIERATKALVTLKAAVGGRSWKVGRAARRARYALESIGGLDLARQPALSTALDDVMALAISPAPKKRLPLEDALTVLWAVDAKTVARVIGHWRAKMLDGGASASIGVLAATIAGVPDPELAVHVGTALVNRRLPPAAFQRWFGRLRPFLEAELPKAKAVDAFLATLKPGNDAVLAARLKQVRP